MEGVLSSPRYTFNLEEFDFKVIHGWLTTTYWSPGISRERVEKGFRGSTLVVGCFVGQVQVGAARCLSDTTRFSYIADVYVSKDHRGKGIARKMVSLILEHPLVSDADSCYLLTQDAHGVYRALGFEVLTDPDRVMVRRK